VTEGKQIIADGVVGGRPRWTTTVIVALLLHAALTGRYGLLPERELCEYVRRRNWFDEAVNALAASGYLVDPVAALTGEESAQ
jgi:hypothetical protein